MQIYAVHARNSASDLRSLIDIHLSGLKPVNNLYDYRFP